MTLKLHYIYKHRVLFFIVLYCYITIAIRLKEILA